MAISKVVLSNDDGTSRTLVDLTGDTVNAESLAEGVTAHGADGNLIIGTREELAEAYIVEASTFSDVDGDSNIYGDIMVSPPDENGERVVSTQTWAQIKFFDESGEDIDSDVAKISKSGIFDDGLITTNVRASFLVNCLKDEQVIPDIDFSKTTATSRDVVMLCKFYDEDGNLVEGTLPISQGYASYNYVYDDLQCERTALGAYSNGVFLCVSGDGTTNQRRAVLYDGSTNRFYVKINGTMSEASYEDATAALHLDPSNVLKGVKFPTLDKYYGLLNINEGTATFSSEAEVDTSDATATAEDILADKTAYVNGEKITGTYTPLDTTDATATAADIVSPKTAYINGTKVEGTLGVFPNNQIATNPDLLLQSSGGSSVPNVMLYAYYSGTDKVLKQSSTVGMSVSNATLASIIHLTADKIVSGNTILGVSGSVAIQKYYTGTSAPANSFGNDGDIYLVTG